CLLIGHREKGYGAVVMTNSDSGDQIVSEVVRAIAAAYQWEGYAAEPIEPAKLDAPALAALSGRYQLSTDEVLTLTPKAGRMDARVSLQKGFELIPVSADTFLRSDADVKYTFSRDASGRDQVVIASQQGGESRTGRRVAEAVRVLADDLEAGKLDYAIAGYRRLFDAKRADPSVGEGGVESLGVPPLAPPGVKAGGGAL